MRTLLTFAILLFATCARAGMREAVVAASLLTDITSARVIRLTLEEGATTPEVYGIVFPFEHAAWCYTAEFGNRVLGPDDKSWAEPRWLQAQLHATGIPVTQVVVYAPVPRSSADVGRVTLNNACVIAALVELQRRLLTDAGAKDAGLVLLSYHVDDAARSTDLLVDHCLLVFREAGRWQCLDPAAPEATVSLERVEIGAPLDAGLLAIALRPRYPLKSVRLLRVAPSTLDEITTATLWRRHHRPSVEAP